MQARLQIVVNSLKATIIFNPVMTLVCLTPFAVPNSPFGTVGWVSLAAAFGLQLASAAIAFLVRRRYQQVQESDLGRLENVLIACQLFFGTAWGAMAFLAWIPGNPVNQILVIMNMAIVSYAAVFSRSMQWKLLVAGLATQAGLTLLRLVTAGEQVAHVMAPFILGYTIYLLMMGRASSRQATAMITGRIANEELAAALRIARDDALRKRYEAETANASKTAFLANMSHELRTPLNAILGFSDIIAHQSMGPGQLDRYSDYAADIHSSGVHLLSLINDILDVAKIESGRMEIEPHWVDPKAVVENAVRFTESHSAQKGQSVEIAIAADTPLVLADERAFRQMLLNLLSNAVKFAPQGGRIGITCAASTGGGLEIAVRDNGPGIPEEKLERVLEPFSQIDNRFDREAGGTGLGLALVNGLARLHGGNVALANNPEGGLTATIYFPSTMSRDLLRATA
ncbi:MAG: HAMP domain-containing histidine kinase [Alphaproteobacteria bacterium]|nr:HAMP domain-containing histidine kinase [Alphaproteobacteria bacterium]